MKKGIVVSKCGKRLNPTKEEVKKEAPVSRKRFLHTKDEDDLFDDDIKIDNC